MSALSLRLPESIHKELKKIAKSDRISINQFISLAVAEKISCLKTVDYLRQRAVRGKKDDFLKVLAMAPDVKPEEYDKIK